MSTVRSQAQLQRFVLAAIFVALIIVFTVVPFTGYITYAPMLLEITTLHIVVIIGAVSLGWKYGALLGGVWGFTNLLRAFTNPLWVLFTNPMISVVPRILVGLIAGLVFAALSRTRMPKVVAAGITGAVGSLTNTVLVLTALHLFGGMFDSWRAVYDILKSVWNTLISVNGAIELIAAILLVPAVYTAIKRLLPSAR